MNNNEVVYKFERLPIKELYPYLLGKSEAIVNTTDENGNISVITLLSPLIHLKTKTVYDFKTEIEHNDQIISATITITVDVKLKTASGKISFSIPEKEEKKEKPS